MLPMTGEIRFSRARPLSTFMVSLLLSKGQDNLSLILFNIRNQPLNGCLFLTIIHSIQK